MPTSKSCRMSSWLVLSLCLICSTLMSAQSTGGRILGRVEDTSGAVLANVKVTATNDATGIARETKTNASGDYVFPEVPVGTYTLSFDLSGFKTNVRKSVALDLNQVINLNISMQVGASKEVVEVTSEAPLVDTTSTQLGAVVNDRSVSQLPLNARDTYQLLQLQPGVMSTVGTGNSVVYGSDKSGAVSVNGGRGRSNNFESSDGPAITRQHFRVSGAHQRLRRRIRPQLRFGGQRCDKVRNQQFSWKLVRVLPEYLAECRRLLPGGGERRSLRGT